MSANLSKHTIFVLSGKGSDPKHVLASCCDKIQQAWRLRFLVLVREINVTTKSMQALTINLVAVAIATI